VKKSNKEMCYTRRLTVSETIAVILEKYMLIKIDSAWEDSELQFGFKKRCSTNHAIFLLRETLIRNRNKNKKSYICFMDFSKAFDKVVRAILLSKISEFLDDHHWSCLYSYYSNSQIIITNNGIRDRTLRTTTGVKQGGPLSPKLFSVYVSEMVDKIATKYNSGSKLDHNIILYADDTTLIAKSQEELQRLVNEIHEYCTVHGIKININKTKCMVVGNRLESSLKITLENVDLEIINKFKYLGWWLESNLSSREHIKTRKMAATVASYQLRKIGFHNENMGPELKVLLRDAYSRSKMNYAIENTYLCNKDYVDLNLLECKILKASLGFNRQHSSTLINCALNITPIERQIKMRKLKFTLELLDNKVTAEVINEYLRNTRTIPKKSLIHETLTICGNKNQVIHENELKVMLNASIREFEEETRTEVNSDTASAVGYLLKRNSSQSKDVLKRLLHWENNRDIVQTLKKKKNRMG
jgi:hypothetical protein